MSFSVDPWGHDHAAQRAERDSMKPISEPMSPRARARQVTPPRHRWLLVSAEQMNGVRLAERKLRDAGLLFDSMEADGLADNLRCLLLEWEAAA